MSMSGIGYRTAAARAMSGRAFNTAAAAIGRAGAASSAVAAAQRTATAVNRFATRGNIANLLASVVAGWALNEILKNAASEQGLSFPGFQWINDCFAGPPSGRAIQAPNPSICATLINLSQNMFVDWSANEKAFGFRIATPIPAFPLSNQTRTNYAPIGPSAAQVRPVVYPNGYFDRPFLPINPWPGDVEATDDGIVLRGVGVVPKAEAWPPEIAPESRPVAAPPSHPLILPTRLLWARKAFDAFQPAGQRSETGPRPARATRPFDVTKNPAWEGYAPSVPLPERAVEIGQDGIAINIPATRPLLRAGANVREHKVKAPMAGGWKGATVKILKDGFGQARKQAT